MKTKLLERAGNHQLTHARKLRAKAAWLERGPLRVLEAVGLPVAAVSGIAVYFMVLALHRDDWEHGGFLVLLCLFAASGGALGCSLALDGHVEAIRAKAKALEAEHAARAVQN